jgi:hypothetical protein
LMCAALPHTSKIRTLSNFRIGSYIKTNIKPLSLTFVFIVVCPFAYFCRAVGPRLRYLVITGRYR